MIAKGNLHGDGATLARYMLTGEKGERAELLETRGLEDFNGDPVKAFTAFQGIADTQTKCLKPFFHTQTRNAPGEHLTNEQWLRVADREEKRLGFTGQPRIVSFHINPESGEKHLHVAWFRVDLDTMRAIDPGMFKNHLKELSRTLEKEFSLREVSNERAPEDKTRAPDRKEFEEARRLKTDLKAIRNTVLDCWQRSDNGKALNAALDAHGLMLANGDRRDCFVVIDQAGGQHALNKKLTGLTLAETRNRLGDLDREQLPGVDAAKAQQQMRAAAREARQPDRAGIELAAELAMQEARAAAQGRTDDVRQVSIAAAARVTEPQAPNWDRDAAAQEWQDQVAAAGIANDAAPEAHQRPDTSAGREEASAFAKASADRRAGAEPEDMRPLGKTAGEIRMAWTLSRTAEELEEALAARGISLAEVSAEEARQSQRTAAFAKEVGNFGRVLREKEIVAIDQYGTVHRFDQRTTGDLRPEIEARFDGFAGIDRAGLLDIAATKEAMQEASRAAWVNQRQAEREQARPASWIEQRIAECAETARREGTTVQQDREGRRVNDVEAFADRQRPEGERETRAVKIYGSEAFAVLLEKAGIAIARVNEHDARVLDSLREVQAKDQMLAGAIDETYQGNRLDPLLMGDLAAVTRNGDAYAINPEKMGGAVRYMADELPGVTATRDRFRSEREATTDLWAELRERNAEARAERDAAYEGDRALHDTVNAGERGVENTLDAADDAVNAGLHAAFGGFMAKAVERVLAGVFSFFGGGEPKLTPQQSRDQARADTNEETLHARAYAAAEQEKEAETDARIFELVRQQQQDKHREDMGLSDAPASRKSRDDYDGGYEREQ